MTSAHAPNLQKDVQLALSLEQRLADQHFGEDGRKREHVALAAELLPEHLFRGHVPELATNLAIFGRWGAASNGRDAKVGQLHVPGAAQQDVGWTDVAVDELERLSLVVDRVMGVV